MGENSKPLTKIADSISPGVATAAAQAGLTKDEQLQLAAFGELKKTHQYLLTLPQNDAYKNFRSLTPEYQTALTTYFNPKYKVEDKGFFGNVLRSLKSSADYAGQTFKELGMQIAGLPIIIHIMKLYIKYGFKDFIIAAGYKSVIVENYFQKNKFNKIRLNYKITSIYPSFVHCWLFFKIFYMFTFKLNNSKTCRRSYCGHCNQFLFFL